MTIVEPIQLNETQQMHLVLTQALNLLDNGSHWTKRTSSMALGNGEYAYCSIGAMHIAIAQMYGIEWNHNKPTLALLDDVMVNLYLHLVKVFNHVNSIAFIPSWNDDTYREWSEVEAAFKNVIQYLEGREEYSYANA